MVECRWVTGPPGRWWRGPVGARVSVGGRVPVGSAPARPHVRQRLHVDDGVDDSNVVLPGVDPAAVQGRQNQHLLLDGCHGRWGCPGGRLRHAGCVGDAVRVGDGPRADVDHRIDGPARVDDLRVVRPWPGLAAVWGADRRDGQRHKPGVLRGELGVLVGQHEPLQSGVGDSDGDEDDERYHRVEHDQHTVRVVLEPVPTAEPARSGGGVVMVQSGEVDDGYPAGAKIEELTSDGVLTRWAPDGSVIEQTTGHAVEIPVEEPDLAAQVAAQQVLIDDLIAALGGGNG